MKKVILFTCCFSTLSFAQTYDRVAVDSIQASSEQSPNVVYNLVDNDLDTRWSAQGFGASVEFDLNSYSNYVDRIGIAWYKGDQRQSRYKIEYLDFNGEWRSLFEEKVRGEPIRSNGMMFFLVAPN